MTIDLANLDTKSSLSGTEQILLNDGGTPKDVTVDTLLAGVVKSVANPVTGRIGFLSAGRYTAPIRLTEIAERARSSNPRVLGGMTNPPTVTANNTTLPAGQTNGYLRSAFADMYRESGGEYVGGSIMRYKSAVIWTSGGNIGDSAGGMCSFARVRFLADANKITFRFNGTTTPYRFLVNGQYVSFGGHTTTATSGNQYMTLDFTDAGGRRLREITLELNIGTSFNGVYVGATERIFQASAPEIRSVCLGDSYCYGSSATITADGIDAVFADNMGWQAHVNSGSGGTGWATTNSAYTFGQRINNGDLLLGGTPDIVCLQGSINDKGAAAADVTAACLAGLVETRRQLPSAPILVFGVWPVSGGAGGSLSVADNEAAIATAVAAFNDPMCAFIPISGAVGQPWISGTGYVGSTTGTGSADVWMFDGSHLNTAGCERGGWLKARAAYDALYAMGL